MSQAPPIIPAGPEHSEALVEFFRHHAIASPQMAYRVDRGPDYFAICRLQGHSHQVLLSAADSVLGTMTVTFDHIFHAGAPLEVAYTCDLRVDAAARGTGLADRLMRRSVEVAREALGPQVGILTAVAADNPAGLKKNANLGRDGLTTMQPIGRIQLHFLAPFVPPLAVRPFLPYRVRPATLADLPAMAALWADVNRQRDFARAYTPESFTRWVTTTPGLSPEAYLLAVDSQDRLKAFLGVWNQAPLRRFVLSHESPAIRAIRQTWNTVRPLANLPHFPSPGEQLPFHNAVNVCVPEHEAEALPMLLEQAFRVSRREGSLFIGLALDERDPLNRLVKRFIGSTSDLVLLGNEPFHGAGKRMFHIEIALG